MIEKLNRREGNKGGLQIERTKHDVNKYVKE